MNIDQLIEEFENVRKVNKYNEFVDFLKNKNTAQITTITQNNQIIGKQSNLFTCQNTNFSQCDNSYELFGDDLTLSQVDNTKPRIIKIKKFDNLELYLAERIIYKLKNYVFPIEYYDYYMNVTNMGCLVTSSNQFLNRIFHFLNFQYRIEKEWFPTEIGKGLCRINENQGQTHLLWNIKVLREYLTDNNINRI